MAKARDWTIKEVTILKMHYMTKTDAELQELLPGRNPGAIYSKALTLGMRGKYKQYR